MMATSSNSNSNSSVSSSSKNSPPASEDLVQILFKATKAEKLHWQSKAKAEGKDLSKVIRDLLHKWTGGESIGEAEQRKLEEQAWEEERAFAELMENAEAWPVGVPRKVEKAEIRAERLPPSLVWIDEVGNWFAEDMSLLTKDGHRDNRQGGGGLLRQLTWKPAILGGWRPRAEDDSFFTNNRWKYVMARMRETGMIK